MSTIVEGKLMEFLNFLSNKQADHNKKKRYFLSRQIKFDLILIKNKCSQQQKT